jgi:tetratricopeptide (TPR) repeat protein
VETALDHYAVRVARAPEPSYVIEYGELLESVGRRDEAEQQYDVFLATQQLFAANGVEPDSVATLFDANHGDPMTALEDATAGIQTRPFLAMYDAYAWALHRNDRNAEALVAVEEAMQLGERNALFRYHAGMIRLALGDSDGARTDLTEALSINASFNPLAAPIATATLAELGGPTGESPADEVSEG